MALLRVPADEGDHIQGSLDTQCVLVEYGDYECPHCGRAHPIVQRVRRHFGKRLAFVFRNFPLTQIHPYAEPAAETAEFADSKGRFWQMHDLLFANQDRLGDDLFQELTLQLDLDPTELLEALDQGTFKARVRADFASGVRSGVNGTPTFFINGRRHDGPFDFEALVEAIDESMRG